jgi:hypothetical protein
MWAAVSAAHTERTRRVRLYEATSSDALLAEQLTLLAMLHDWRPVTVAEAEELTYALRTYSDDPDEKTRAEASTIVSRYIRAMAETRAASAPFPHASQPESAAVHEPGPARQGRPSVPQQRSSSDDWSAPPPAPAREEPPQDEEVDPLAPLRALIDLPSSRRTGRDDRHQTVRETRPRRWRGWVVAFLVSSVVIALLAYVIHGLG